MKYFGELGRGTRNRFWDGFACGSGYRLNFTLRVNFSTYATSQCNSQWGIAISATCSSETLELIS